MKNWPSTLLALLLLLPLAGAQTREKIPAPDFERATVVDEEGYKLWAPIEEAHCDACKRRGERTCEGCNGVEMPKCTECDGEKTAPCRVCCGKKVLPDPILELGCPYCKASGWYDCGQCNGFGVYFSRDQAGNRTELVCRACDKKGRYECAACDGDRLIPTVRIKKKKLPWESKLKDVQKVRVELEGLLTWLEAFTPGERAATSFKEWEKVFKKPTKELPRLKGVISVMDQVLDGLRKEGAGYEGFEASNSHEMMVMRDRTIYDLQYQLRVIDQSIALIEHNEKVDDRN